MTVPGSPERVSLEPANTVFVDVDTQVDFVEPSGALYVPSAETLKPAFQRLLDAARRHGCPVVASADAHSPGDPEFDGFPAHCLAGSAGARRVAETDPGEARVFSADGEHQGGDGAVTLLEKRTFDLFDNPAATDVFANLGVKTAIVFGVALDYCVRAAALGLVERGYETVLVRDATAPVTREGGEAAAAELSARGVRFMTTDDVVRAFP